MSEISGHLWFQHAEQDPELSENVVTTAGVFTIGVLSNLLILENLVSMLNKATEFLTHLFSNASMRSNSKSICLC